MLVSKSKIWLYINEAAHLVLFKQVQNSVCHGKNSSPITKPQLYHFKLQPTPRWSLLINNHEDYHGTFMNLKYVLLQLDQEDDIVLYHKIKRLSSPLHMLTS